MARVAFHLKRYNETTPQRVFALYHVDGRQVKLYTSVSVRPKDWLRTKQRVKAGAPNAAPMNDELSAFARIVETEAFRLQREGALTAERLKLAVQPTEETVAASSATLVAQIDRWIEDAKKRQRAATIRIYSTLRNHIKTFGERRRAEPLIADVDKKFVDDFAHHLTSKAQLANTSLWNMLKTLKTFLRWAHSNGLTSNRTFERMSKKDHHVIERPIVRLNENDLRAIASLDLETEPALANARDLFMLQCALGVRYSDLVKVSSANIDGDFIRITTEKNRKEVAVPLLPTARRIIERARPPHPISNQKLNAYLKEIARRAKLDSAVTIPVFKGTQRVECTYALHELVTTHTAKRTFVSLMIGRGVSVDTVMKITGNSRSTLERYINLDNDDVRTDLAKAADLFA